MKLHGVEITTEMTFAEALRLNEKLTKGDMEFLKARPKQTELTILCLRCRDIECYVNSNGRISPTAADASVLEYIQREKKRKSEEVE